MEGVIQQFTRYPDSLRTEWSDNNRTMTKNTLSPLVHSRDFPRRHFFGMVGTMSLGTLAGCSSILETTQTKTGALRIRVRNISDTSHRITVRVYVNNEESVSFSNTITLEAPGEAPHTERFWPNAIESVSDEAPYRVVAVVDDTQHEKSDIANCIYHDGDRGTETINISIRENKTKILTEDCPADSQS